MGRSPAGATVTILMPMLPVRTTAAAIEPFACARRMDGVCVGFGFADSSTTLLKLINAGVTPAFFCVLDCSTFEALVSSYVDLGGSFDLNP